ncbi:glycosyltransferase [Stenotrophomonas nitritireducens]|uniref:glycosyltransferase n=1 Tax=Stenotrophomonas nitritireducens TaxID=83617 RepID=UPI001FCCE7C4|nr:glycosyltransferase [Stenotrophomonas nitritireducens]
MFTSTSYPLDASDWRGLFIKHISTALARSGLINLRQWAPPGDRDFCVIDASTEEEAEWLAALMHRGGISHWLRAKPVSGISAAIKLLRMLNTAYRRNKDVDLHHINWLQCALPLPADGKPVLVTALGNDMKLLRMPMMRHALRHALRNRPAMICPNADWMREPLYESFGDLAEIRPIPFGVDPQWYAIRRQPKEPPCWLAITRLTQNKLGPLFEWSEPLFRSGKRQLHLFGPMQEQVVIPDWIFYHGPAKSRQLIDEWFPRVHGLITLSCHAEGRPQVMLEAMAAGMPIIASHLPAHADIVEDGVTGALCGSPSEYAKAVEKLEDRDLNHAQGETARALAHGRIGTWDDCASRYMAAYRCLLKGAAHD